MPTINFQALILCGPGESLQPFTANSNDFPKALLPIANRPMVWYALDWCHRMGVSDITLVTPPSCSAALEAALSTNPHLTSLPAPRPTVLAPEDLTLTTGTAEIFRMVKVQTAITGDFFVLPCDLVCEMSGLSLLDSWMVLQGGLSQSFEEEERRGRRGGLGVWYHTKDSVAEGGVGVKKEETDFLATVDLPKPIVPPAVKSLRPRIEEVVLTMPTAVLKDKLDEEQGVKLRHALLQKHGKLKMKMTCRDAHVYLFPQWVKEFMRRNETFDSVGEDVLGWWAKARWQDGLPAKLGLDHSVARRRRSSARRASRTTYTADTDGFIDLAALSSTSSFVPTRQRKQDDPEHDETQNFASRVPTDSPSQTSTQTPPQIPPTLAYIHPSQPTASLLRRIDTVQLLLSASIFLAKLPPAPETSSPFAHEYKVHPSSQPSAGIRLTLDQATSLVDANVTLTSKSTIKESVIGASCVLGAPSTAPEGVDSKEAIRNAPPGVNLQRCLLMEGAVVDQDCKLNGCILGRRCRIGKGSDLRDCFVQEGYAVPEGTIAKGEVFAGFDEGDGTLDEDDDDTGDMFAGPNDGDDDELYEDGTQT